MPVIFEHQELIDIAIGVGILSATFMLATGILASSTHADKCLLQQISTTITAAATTAAAAVTTTATTTTTTSTSMMIQ